MNVLKSSLKSCQVSLYSHMQEIFTKAYKYALKSSPKASLKAYVSVEFLLKIFSEIL